MGEEQLLGSSSVGNMTGWGKRILIGTALLAVYMLLRIDWGFEAVLTLFTGMLIGVCLAGALVWWRDRNW